MTDFYLSFTSEEQANTILADTAQSYSIDVLGFTDKYPTQYLVNLRGADTDVWNDYKSTPDPQVPIRVFA